MLGPGTFRFLNETRDLEFPAGWNDREADKLWLYNLHYFEDLLAERSEERTTWHRDLIDAWVAQNPLFEGEGWEPYPVSLRIVYWIKWALEGNELMPSWLDSLALQAEFLHHRVEWHLLGNHVFENAKALVLAGSFFEGALAGKWRRRGLAILSDQLDEQILPDGGHFERSPMYHALVLEGLLDLIQVSELFGLNGEQVEAWRQRAAEMVAWLQSVSHPDGEIAFFNDAAFGVALPPAVLIDYAKRLDIRIPERARQEGIRYLEDSGYIRFDRGPWSALLDVAPLGPDYQPGHAHADTLSFELSVGGRRVLVNSGTSVYGLGGERTRQRGTPAHNTVVVDGQSSSEVWSGFRVARRARPFDISVRGVGQTWEAAASHDGYRRLPGRVTHRRVWTFSGSRLVVEDELAGQLGSAVAYFHFHPDADLTFDGVSGEAKWRDGRIGFVVEKGEGELRSSSYHPEFGISLDSQCLAVALSNGESRLVFES